jgi:putative membrane protein
MNERIIKVAHVVAVGIFMLVAVVVVASQGQDTSGQNGNSNQSSSRQGSSKNANKSEGTGGQGTGMTLGSADRKFIMEAAMGGMAEVELGRLASERGSSETVKQFGQRMVDDHSRANGELTQLASSKGITLPTALDAKHQAAMAKMAALSGAAFDRAYSKDMVKDHNKDVALFQREASQGADADLKAFAQKTLPTLQEHLQMARSLPGGNGTMNGNMNRSGQR